MANIFRKASVICNDIDLFYYATFLFLYGLSSIEVMSIFCKKYHSHKNEDMKRLIYLKSDWVEALCVVWTYIKVNYVFIP